MAENPGAGVGLEADAGVVFDRSRGRQQHEERARAHLFAGLRDEFLPDALTLVGGVDGEIGEVTDVGKVRQGAGESDEAVTVPGGDEQGSVADHVGDDGGIIDGPARREGRGLEHGDDGVHGDVVANAVRDHGKQVVQTRDWPPPS